MRARRSWQLLLFACIVLLSLCLEAQAIGSSFTVSRRIKGDTHAVVQPSLASVGDAPSTDGDIDLAPAARSGWIPRRTSGGNVESQIAFRKSDGITRGGGGGVDFKSVDVAMADPALVPADAPVLSGASLDYFSLPDRTPFAYRDGPLAGVLFVLLNGHRWAVRSSQVAAQYGIAGPEVLLPASQAYADGGVLDFRPGTLVTYDGERVYRVEEGGTRRAFRSAAVQRVYVPPERLASGDVVRLPAAHTLADVEPPIDFPDGTLIRYRHCAGNPSCAVYAVCGGGRQRCRFLSDAVMRVRGLSAGHAIELDDTQPYEDGPALDYPDGTSVLFDGALYVLRGTRLVPFRSDVHRRLAGRRWIDAQPLAGAPERYTIAGEFEPWPVGALVWCEGVLCRIGDGNVRHPFRSAAVLRQRGIDPDSGAVLGADDCASLALGAAEDLLPGTVFTYEEAEPERGDADAAAAPDAGAGGTVYRLEGGRRRPFPNHAVLQTYNLAYASALRVPREAHQYPDGDAMPLAEGALVRLAHNATLYRVAGGVLRRFGSAAVAQAWGVSAEAAVVLPVGPSEPVYATGEDWPFPDGALLAAETDPRLWRVQSGQRRWVVSEDVRRLHGWHTQPVIAVPTAELQTLPMGAPIGPPDGTLFRYDNDTQVYRMDNGQQRAIVPAEALRQLGWDTAPVLSVPAEAGPFPVGPCISFLEHKRAAGELSDAMLVWIALPPDAFWANLNPQRPDLILSDDFAATELGMVLLEADLDMKRHVGQLIHPDTPLGDRFWHTFYARFPSDEAKCFSFRQWVVPGNVSVVKRNGALQVLNASLDVQMESTYLKNVGLEVRSACPAYINPRIPAYAEELFRDMVLPELARSINTLDVFADMRALFQSRVLSTYYRQAMEADAALQASVEHFKARKLHRWQIQHQRWTPQSTFARYVQSASRGEFAIEREREEGEFIYTYAYFYGGIDWSTLDERVHQALVG